MRGIPAGRKAGRTGVPRARKGSRLIFRNLYAGAWATPVKPHEMGGGPGMSFLLVLTDASRPLEWPCAARGNASYVIAGRVRPVRTTLDCSEKVGGDFSSAYWPYP